MVMNVILLTGPGCTSCVGDGEADLVVAHIVQQARDQSGLATSTGPGQDHGSRRCGGRHAESAGEKAARSDGEIGNDTTGLAEETV